MALLDVSDVLLDPDFMDAGLVCKRSTQLIGSDGRATNTVTTTSFTGVVTSDSGDLLERLSAGERKKGSITIHTQFALSSGGPDQSADLVTWRGRDYTVSNVNDYGHFGRGFYAATCDLLPLAG